MISTEFHTGKLIPVKLKSTIFLECINIGQNNGLEYDYDDLHNDIIEKFKEYFNHSNAKKYNRDEYLIFDDKLFKVENHYYSWDEEETFCKMFKESDGSISFITQFHNGGTCFTEMMEEELNKD